LADGRAALNFDDERDAARAIDDESAGPPGPAFAGACGEFQRTVGCANTALDDAILDRLAKDQPDFPAHRRRHLQRGLDVRRERDRHLEAVASEAVRIVTRMALAADEDQRTDDRVSGGDVRGGIESLTTWDRGDRGSRQRSGQEQRNHVDTVQPR
jgi:hypothetical protein